MSERLPNADAAIVEEKKITGYLLSKEHPDGQGKAIFFERFGFTSSGWERLREALLEHAKETEVRLV